ncbi:2-keto-4-pentenoate hydratase [Ramlibacter sp. MAHUQ-53]|uniref:2-keto-4-pentenoate hydratase n=1 Tax=unclassified Ramlibacter TaxID=2617605 RepID=UPI00363769DF
MHDHLLRAATELADSLRGDRHVDALPDAIRPRTRAEGYAAQAAWPALLGQPVAGWKIAATSEAGQRHIAVSGPLAGPVFAHRVAGPGAAVSLAGNRMRVAECEVVFTLGRTLAPRAGGYTREEVLAAVATVHPGIEVPDSRFAQFERAGEAQLVADCACCRDMVLGAPVAPEPQQLAALPGLQVRARVSDGRTAEGVGRNVLGDPVEALVWFVNEIGAAGQAVQAGQFVTTGACVPPIPVAPGQRVEADFGWLGTLAAEFT